MGGVNFLADNKNNNQENKQERNAAGNFSNFKWTNPEKLNNQDSNFADANAQLRPELKNNLVNETGNSGKTSAGKEAGIKADQTDGRIENQPVRKFIGGFLNRLSSLKRGLGRDSNVADSLTDRKKIIAEYGEVFNNEKSYRKNDAAVSKAVIDGNRHNVGADAVNYKAEKGKNNSLVDRWVAPRILKTDLIKGELTIFIDWKKNLKYLSVNLLLAGVIIAIAYAGLIFWGQSSAQQAETIDKEIQELSKKINDSIKEVAEIDNFQKKLNSISQLLAGHVYWTNFFEFLEKDTLADIYYTGGFKGDLSGIFSLAAKAPSYEEMADQIRIFKSDADFVVSAVADKGSLSSDSGKQSGAGAESPKNVVDFQINLTVKPEIFYK